MLLLLLFFFFISFHEFVYLITLSLSHTHTPCPFFTDCFGAFQRFWENWPIFNLAASLRYIKILHRRSPFGPSLLLVCSKVLTFVFSVSPQLCSFSSSCCVWCQWCVYACCCCLLCVSCFFKHARMWICVGLSMLFCEFHIHSICSTFASVWQVLLKMFNGVCWASCSLHDSKSYGMCLYSLRCFYSKYEIACSVFACCEGFKFSSSILRGGSRLPERICYFQNSGFHVDGTRQPPSPQPPPPNHGASECESASPPLAEKN